MPDPSRRELGDFLRSRRERLTPEAVDLPTGRRRRTPGLRREEVAERAGIGVDWYVRLEQGRAVTPSDETVEALARALRLAETEHVHLQALVRNAGRPPFVRETVPDSIRHLLDHLAQPAYVTGRRWDVIAWNAAAVDLFGDFGRLPEAERNILAWMLTASGARRLFGDTWEAEARRMTAQFRVAHDLSGDDPAFVDLVRDLRARSEPFARWWDDHDVRPTGSGEKTLVHRQRGAVRYAYATFQSNDDPALKIAIYTPA